MVREARMQVCTIVVVVVVVVVSMFWGVLWVWSAISFPRTMRSSPVDRIAVVVKKEVEEEEESVLACLLLS